MGTKSAKLNMELLVSTLDEALDNVLHARVLLGDMSDLVAPTTALDAALVADPAVLQAHRASRVALQRLRDRLGVDGVDDLLLYEDSMNHCTSAACDVAFRFGAGARGQARRRRRLPPRG